MSNFHKSPVTPPSHHVCVIGAGLAGLTFARHVKQNYPEVKITVLESRHRLGGRVWTIKDSPQAPILEAGAEFINADHHHARKLCANLKIPLIPAYKNESSAPTFATIDGAQVRNNFRDLLSHLSRAVRKDKQESRVNPKRKTELQNMSALEYISNIGLSEADASVLSLFVHTEQAVKVDNLSALFLVDWMDFDTFRKGHNSFFAPGDDWARIEGGSSTLVDSLANPLHTSINLGKRVTRISHVSSGNAYYVHIANTNQPIKCDSVVLAAPASVAKHIEMETGHLRELKEHLGRYEYSDVEKLLIPIEGPPLRLLEKYNQVLDMQLRGFLWKTGQYPSASHCSWLAVYRGGDNAGYNMPGKNSSETIETSINNIAGYMPEQANGRSTTRIGLDQRNFEWPEGGWVQPSKSYTGFPYPEGFRRFWESVFFTGEATAKVNRQTMCGAIEAGRITFTTWAHQVFGTDSRLYFIGEHPSPDIS